MARAATRKKDTTPDRSTEWSGLLQADDLATRDAAAREAAWPVLEWAALHATLAPVQAVVPAEKAELTRAVSVVLYLLSHPPAGVDLAERLRLAGVWASRLNHPLVHALQGVLAMEAGQTRAALETFERLKCVGPAFPEVPLVAGRALLQHAGRDSKLLHRAEWFLVHAEHLYLDGGEDEAPETEAEFSDDPEPMECEVEVDASAQEHLAEIWTLMAKLYERLGDRRKADMYHGRAGAAAEEREEASEEPQGGESEFANEPGLKAADRKLLVGFFASPQFSGLRGEEQKQARTSVPYFVALGRTFLGVAPNRLDRYALEELLTALIPEKLVATIEEMGRIPALVASWIHFLGKSGALRDAGRLVPLVHRLAADFMANCRNSDCWGVPKAQAMRALAGGVRGAACEDDDNWHEARARLAG